MCKFFGAFLKLVGLKSNGVVRGAPCFTACESILSCKRGEYVSSFSDFLVILHALYVEVMDVIY